MTNPSKTLIGIDVGGRRKGFHAVALHSGQFEVQHFVSAREVMRWCLSRDPHVLSIDAPCAWAASGKSRRAERTLAIGDETIQCFKTPTRTAAQGRAFYDWVFNGETLYRELMPHYRLYNGGRRKRKVVFETFPHAVVCALAGQLVPARRKATRRRRTLQEEGYDVCPLANIDFVDAALCALTAERFLFGRTHCFGDQDEGFIVVPD